MGTATKIIIAVLLVASAVVLVVLIADPGPAELRAADSAWLECVD
ncbi:hypothetical protein [Microlunatus sp. GCM10028923]